MANEECQTAHFTREPHWNDRCI